jgi:threonine aldolase
MRIDLRSDTVTTPTPELRQAMLEAAVGDDVYGEDPTVNALQDRVAEMLGFEAALFTASGVMANQIAIAAHVQRGQEVICTEGAHIYEYELGMMAAFSGVVPRFVHAPLGAPDPQDVRRAVRRSVHQSPTGLIALENTHNKSGGTIVPLEVIRGVREVSLHERIPMHLDGARAWNAIVALGIEPKVLTQHFDSAAVCLSKGLGAPVGSVVAGSRAFIRECHRYRKMLGGGMRQAGMLAAAGLYVLEHGLPRLRDDHRRALTLAQGLLAAGWHVNLAAVQTNMVYVTVPDASATVASWAARGVMAGAMSDSSVRLVTHFQIGDEDIAAALRAIGTVSIVA